MNDDYSEHPRGSKQWLEDVNAIIRGDRRFAEGKDLWERYELLREVAMDLTAEWQWAIRERDAARALVFRIGPPYRLAESVGFTKGDLDRNWAQPQFEALLDAKLDQARVSLLQAWLERGGDEPADPHE